MENRFIPVERSPGHATRARERVKARLYLLPATVVYTSYAMTMLVLGVRSPHRMSAVLWFVAGLVLWTPLEYAAHRYVLHGTFPPSRNPLKQILHRMFDETHIEHHRKPWAAKHLSGSFKTTLPIVLVWSMLALLAPWYTVLLLVAGIVQAFIIEEWVHYAVHFEDFTGRYWEYIRRHHMYHHSKIGSEVAYGLTNGVWDVVWDTRIPEPHRRALYKRRDGEPNAARAAERADDAPHDAARVVVQDCATQSGDASGLDLGS
jgi:sterol desaturase/sphingolipid hydroxylase (fatty acid hydroxylase superfamily)